MTSLFHAYHIKHLEEIRNAAMVASDAAFAVSRNLRLREGKLVIGPYHLKLKHNARVFVIALGKAAPAMCHAAVESLQDRLIEGIATIPRGYAKPFPSRIHAIPTGHPLPDGGSLSAGCAVASMLSTTSIDDLVVGLAYE